MADDVWLAAQAAHQLLQPVDDFFERLAWAFKVRPSLLHVWPIARTARRKTGITLSLEKLRPSLPTGRKQPQSMDEKDGLASRLVEPFDGNFVSIYEFLCAAH